MFSFYDSVASNMFYHFAHWQNLANKGKKRKSLMFANLIIGEEQMVS